MSRGARLGVILGFLLVLSSFSVFADEGAAVDEEYADVQFEVDAGLTPDSAFYFLDEFFDVFSSDLEKRQERVAEIKAMIEQGNIEAARQALEKYEALARDLEKEVSPADREEARRSAAAIRKVIRQIEDSIPEDEREDFVGIIEQEGEIVASVEIASKIKELCTQLAELDPLEYSRVCKTEENAPKWQKDLHEDLTAEQQKEAEEFFKIMTQCMRTSGKECRCSDISFSAFAKRCSIIAPLAAKCEEGDEAACEKMDEETDGIEDLLPDYLQDVLKDIEGDFEEESFEQYAPKECVDAGATDEESCFVVMFKLDGPPECAKALEDGDISYSGDHKQLEEDCEKILYETNAPEECIEEGLTNHEDCGVLLFELYSPQECLDAGLTGEHHDDNRRCDEIMKNLKFDDEPFGYGGHGGHGGFGAAHCKEIEDAEARLACYDDATKNAKAFEEKFFEEQKAFDQCFEECSKEGLAWDFVDGDCKCFEPNYYEEYEDEYYEDKYYDEEYYEDVDEQGSHEFYDEDYDATGNLIEEEFDEQHEDDDEREDVDEQDDDKEDIDEQGSDNEIELSGITGNVIADNRFFDYYFR